MNIIKVIIEKTKSRGHYTAYAMNVTGVHGAGDSYGAAVQNILDCIKIIKGFNPDQIPEILKGEYEIEFTEET